MEAITKEVIVMVGYPGSGKSTIANGLKGYYRVDGDSLKTASAMKKDAEKHIGEQSIIFDCTSATKAKRQEFITFARKLNLPVRAFWIQTPIHIAMERNKQRGEEGGIRVPDIAFYVYRKKFEEPTTNEGFDEIVIF